MFTQKNRDRFGNTALGEAVRDEFDNASAESMERFLKEHNQDGSHRFPEGDVVPTGAMLIWPSDTAPNSKWLFCRGQQVSRSTYAALFQIFGTTYGAGDGSTTFNLPDLQQRFPLGKAAAGTGNALGATGGAIDHVHTGPSHTHSITSGGAHTHTISSDGTHAHSIGSDGDHNHGGATGVSNVTTLVDRNLDAITKLVGDADNNDTHNISTDGDHDHGAATGNAGAHDHGAVTGSNGAHDHGALTGASGTGNTGTANPPYLVVNYIIFSGVEVN